MKKSLVMTTILSVVLLGAPVLAQPDAPAGQNPSGQQMAMPGCRMMGGSGMGMGPGMMGGGMGMMGHGKMGGMQACMLGDCWKAGGPMAGMMQCPGPRQTVQAAIQEINGYQMHSAALGLNQDQLARLAGAEEALTTAVIKQRADLQLAALQLRKAMTGDSPDLSAASQTIDRQAELWKSLQKTAIKAAADARGILTPEQRQNALRLGAGCQMQMQQRRPMMGNMPESEGMDHEMHHNGSM